IEGRGHRRGGHQPIQWYLLRRGGTGLLGWLRATDTVAREVSLYYADDATRPDPPERVPGEFGDHGFLYHHDGTPPAGELRLSSYGWILHGNDLDRPAALLEGFAIRPTIQVH